MNCSAFSWQNLSRLVHSLKDKELSDCFLSALIASHRRPIVIEAIKSVLNQDLDMDKYEILVVADTRLNELREFENNTRVKIIYSDRDDPGGKWAEAIEASKGEVLCFLDDDDMWVSNKLSYVKKKFDQDDLLGYFHNGHKSVDFSGNIIPDYKELRHYYAVQKIQEYSELPVKRGSVNFQHLASLGAPFNSSCISIRRSLVVPYLDYLSRGKWMVDYFWFYAFAVSLTRILIEDIPLTLYRRRPDIRGERLNNMENGREQKIEIYRRYLSSHEIYKDMGNGLEISTYFHWIIAKIKIMLTIYSTTDFHVEKKGIISELIRNMPLNDFSSVSSTLLLAFAYFIRIISVRMSMSFLMSLERLKLSVL